MFFVFLKLVLTVLLVLDPIGIVPQYMGLTMSMSADVKKLVVRKSVIIAACVLFVFILFGRLLLLFFGISPGAFYIAGGILFFLIAFEMIYSKPRSRQTPAEDSSAAHDASFVALFPLAIPLIAGPGLITTIMLYVTDPSRPWVLSVLLLVPAIAIGLVAAYIALRCASLLFRVIGMTGMFVLEKIMGLILSGLSVQLVYDGLVKLNILGGM